ncbi:MAG TPA: tetratricopeptide repeat protein [Rhizomicrobium sp.]|nr:tetratricopeptide repeat protein [Rhizomicrobium sp.]
MDINQLYAQAVSARNGGNLVEAERLYRAILDQAPIPEVLVNHGNVLTAMGRPGEALAAYDQALAARPDFFEALFNRANLLLETRRTEEALVGFERAVAVRPDAAPVWNNRGTALRHLRRLEEALASYDRAAALTPGNVNALTNRAMTLYDLRRSDEALAVADEVLAIQSAFAEALYLRGNILRDRQRPLEAAACYEQALAANPAHPHALNGLAQSALQACDWKRSAALAPRLKDAIESGRALIQPMVLMGYSDDGALLRRAAERYIHHVAPVQPPLASKTRYGHERIRLAYLSADFHQHPTAQLMVELFERHDRSRFEVTAIAFGPDDNSPMRDRLKKAFDRFEDVRGMSDTEVARLLRERETDIAVDLNGHTQDARPGIFAHHPATLQINYLVYPGTTGASYMDHTLADRIVLPVDQQPFFSEQIVHLPDCYQANDATRVIPDAPARADCGLPEDGFVLCCFNNSWKLNPPVFDIWMKLLTAVPKSVLWLMDGPHAANLRQEAQVRGVDAARLVFAPKLPPDRHLARHKLADLFLDTLPYNAHTTASDALWAGLPVVTCKGRIFQSRVAASLLTAIGMPELIAGDPAAYETLALQLATNPALLKATREKLARNRGTQPLYDSDRFRKAIEATYTALLG